MTRFETIHLTESYRERCEDRVAVFHHEDRTVIVVADGAGGVGCGDLAAETVIREVGNDHLDITTAEAWETELRQIDLRIGAGESTAVIVELRSDAPPPRCHDPPRHFPQHDLTQPRRERRRPNDSSSEGVIFLPSVGFQRMRQEYLRGHLRDGLSGIM